MFTSRKVKCLTEKIAVLEKENDKLKKEISTIYLYIKENKRHAEDIAVMVKRLSDIVSKKEDA